MRNSGKKILLILVTMLLAILIFFILKTESIGPKQPSVDLDGTWKPVGVVESGAISLVDGEHYIFENDIASYYQLDFENPIMTSSYRITQDNPPKLELTDIEKSYVVKFRSDNYVELYSDKSTYTAILRAKEMDSQGSLEGIWKVAYRKTDEVLEEVFEIIDNELVFYRNDMEEPFAISQLVWDGVDVFTAHSLGKTMKVHYVEYDIVQLIETDTGYLWELHRTD